MGVLTFRLHHKLIRTMLRHRQRLLPSNLRRILPLNSLHIRPFFPFRHFNEIFAYRIRFHGAAPDDLFFLICKRGFGEGDLVADLLVGADEIEGPTPLFRLSSSISILFEERVGWRWWREWEGELITYPKSDISHFSSSSAVRDSDHTGRPK